MMRPTYSPKDVESFKKFVREKLPGLVRYIATSRFPHVAHLFYAVELVDATGTGKLGDFWIIDDDYPVVFYDAEKILQALEEYKEIILSKENINMLNTIRQIISARVAPSDEELATYAYLLSGVLHELLHIVFLHPTKVERLKKTFGEKYNHHLFNIIADARVNWTLETLGFPTPPEVFVTFEHLQKLAKNLGKKLTRDMYIRLTDTEIYYWFARNIEKEKIDLNKAFTQAFGFCPLKIPEDKLPPWGKKHRTWVKGKREGEEWLKQNAPQLHERWKKMKEKLKRDKRKLPKPKPHHLKQAWQRLKEHLKSRGLEYSDLVYMVQRFETEPYLDWEELLLSIVSQYATYVYMRTYQKLKKKWLPYSYITGIPFPSYVPIKGPGAVFYVVDASGSISDKEFVYFTNELIHLVERYSHLVRKIYYMTFTVTVHDFEVFDTKTVSPEDIKLVVRERPTGGTIVGSVFEVLRHKIRENPELLRDFTDSLFVILSDGEFEDDFGLSSFKKLVEEAGVRPARVAFFINTPNWMKFPKKEWDLYVEQEAEAHPYLPVYYERGY